MKIKYKELLECLEKLAFESIIADDLNIVDIKITGYSFNTFDNLIYPEFLVLLNPDENDRHSLNYIKTSICSDLQKYNESFFSDCFCFLSANVKIKTNPQV